MKNKASFKKLNCLYKEKGKGAKIVTVNLKMGNYNSGKLMGAKLYTVN